MCSVGSHYIKDTASCDNKQNYILLGSNNLTPTACPKRG